MIKEADQKNWRLSIFDSHNEIDKLKKKTMFVEKLQEKFFKKIEKSKISGFLQFF